MPGAPTRAGYSIQPHQSGGFNLDANLYEIISLAMRYVFTAIGVVIVWRTFSWLRKDRQTRHRRLKQLPDAGAIGLMTVLDGKRAGLTCSVPREGTLGFLRTCDVVIPLEGVADVHADFTFVDGKGLYVYPRRGLNFIIDGEPIRNRRDAKNRPMQHGSVLEFGTDAVQLGVFAGLQVQEALWLPPVDAPCEFDPYGGMPDA